jgi:antitoxin component YwqK of YwqJK toxin-antitoxin module
MKEYFENGNKKTEAVLKDGDFSGLVTVYHPNGKPYMRGIL